MKSFAMLVLSGLVAASLCHSAIAQDASTTPSVQPVAPTNVAPPATPDNAIGNMSAASSANTIDQGTPDTATGDDDY